MSVPDHAFWEIGSSSPASRLAGGVLPAAQAGVDEAEHAPSVGKIGLVARLRFHERPRHEERSLRRKIG